MNSPRHRLFRSMDDSASRAALPETLASNPSAPGEGHLRKTLGPVALWGLGVGYVISGDYFGCDLGLAAGGSGGLLVAFVLMSIMAVAFVFSYTEMACAIRVLVVSLFMRRAGWE